MWTVLDDGKILLILLDVLMAFYLCERMSLLFFLDT